MSAKNHKAYRNTVKKAADQYRMEIVNDWLKELPRWPLHARLKFAWYILRKRVLQFK